MLKLLSSVLVGTVLWGSPSSSLEIIVNNKCNWFMDIYNHDIYKVGGRGFSHVCKLAPRTDRKSVV